MSFNNGDEIQISNVMTADNCQNIMAALQYVAEHTESLSTKGIVEVKSYIDKQVKEWAEKSNGKLTQQDIMYGLLRSHIILRGDADESQPVDVRYAVEHPMRISQMRYGVRLGDENAVRRVAFLLDMLFDHDGKPIYETQRLFLGALSDKLIQNEQLDNQTATAMIKELLAGMKRSANRVDSWDVFSLSMTPEALCYLGGEQVLSPRLVTSNRSGIDGKTIKRERD